MRSNSRRIAVSGSEAVIGAFSGFQDFALALGLVKRERRDLLQPADLDRAARALVEQLDQFAINFVNLAAPVFNIHGRASRRLIPRVAACLSKRTRSATAGDRGVNRRRLPDFRYQGEPTTAASGQAAKDRDVAREVIFPKPIGNRQ